MSVDAMTPIGTYFERGFDWQRRFELYPDKIVINGHVRRAPYRWVVPIAQFDPEYSTQWQHVVRPVYRAILVLVTGVVAAVVAIKLAGVESPPIVFFISVIVALIVGSIPKRVRLFRFTNWSTGFMLDIWECGPERDAAETFVHQIAKAIGRLDQPATTSVVSTEFQSSTSERLAAEPE